MNSLGPRAREYGERYIFCLVAAADFVSQLLANCVAAAA